MKKNAQLPYLIILLLTALLLFLAACGGAVPEAQDAAEVAEEASEEEVVEEVDVEVEEIVEEEVEIEAEMVEEAAEEEEELADAPEIEAEATQVTEFTPTDPNEAVGSEEDDGSPFTPTSGQKKGGDANEADLISWIAEADESIEEPTARVLANHVGDVMVIHTLRTETFEEKVILARSIIFYERKLIDETTGESLEIESETVYLPLSINRWRPITDQLDQLQAFSEASLCEICSPERFESISMITAEESVTVLIDLDQELTEIEELLFLVRDLQTESRARVRLMLDQLE